jgi:NADH-quinone oxidoreductase subunit K
MLHSNFNNIIEIVISLTLVGFTGLILNNRNILKTMLCVELIYINLMILFITLSFIYLDLKTQIFSLVLLILAASESVVGLGLIVVLYRLGKSINFYDYQELRG